MKLAALATPATGPDVETVARTTEHREYAALAREAPLDHIAWAQHVRSEHEATHGEAEQCGAECIVLGLTDFEEPTDDR